MRNLLRNKPEVHLSRGVSITRYTCLSAVVLIAALVVFAVTLFVLPNVKYVKALKGICAYELGRASQSHYRLALECYQRAADLGNARGMDQLGNLFWNGHGVPQDYAQALTWYRRAADLGDADAMNTVGDSYWWGLGEPQDYAQALAWYRKAADRGSANSMFMIGYSYHAGVGVPGDDEQSLAWYRKAAELGFSKAMFCVGDAYRDGRGVPQDHIEALAWYRKAANLGNPDGMNDLGTAYFHGDGVSQDYSLAVAWWRKAADLGSSEAMSNLGIANEGGWGVPKDNAQALVWYRKAAELGDPDAALAVHRFAPQILTKDPAYMQLLHPPQEDALLSLSKSFALRKQEIDAKLATIQDPELRARLSDEEWAKVDRSEYIEQQKGLWKDAFPVAMNSVLARHRSDWFEIGHVNFPSTSELVISPVEASPLILPDGATVITTVAAMDGVYAKFHAQIQGQVENAVSLRAMQQSCDQQLRNVCENLGGSPNQCSEPSELEHVRSTLEFSCQAGPSVDEMRQTMESEIRANRLILVGQGDLVDHRIDKLMLVDYDTESVFIEIPTSSLHGEIRWKSLDPAQWINAQ